MFDTTSSNIHFYIKQLDFIPINYSILTDNFKMLSRCIKKLESPINNKRKQQHQQIYIFLDKVTNLATNIVTRRPNKYYYLISINLF